MAERYDYLRARLREADLDPSPFKQLAQWLETARNENVVEPIAMCLSTVSADCRPSSRIVLLRSLDERGLTFFTNYASRKGQELADNPFVCLNFWWGPLERQVRVEGAVQKVTESESDDYWVERPFDSRLASAASPQSSVIPGREVLEGLVRLLKEAHPDEVPRPSHWGGYRVIPDRFEFWQGGQARLHDRLVYAKNGDGWTIERLAP